MNPRSARAVGEVARGWLRERVRNRP
jgi:hypothetical protein